MGKWRRKGIDEAPAEAPDEVLLGRVGEKFGLGFCLGLMQRRYWGILQFVLLEKSDNLGIHDLVTESEMKRYVETRPGVVMHRESEDRAILFDPDTGVGFELNPAGVFVWQHLDGHHSIAVIAGKMRHTFDGVAEDAEEHIRELVAMLIEQGLAGYVFRVEGGGIA